MSDDNTDVEIGATTRKVDLPWSPEIKAKAMGMYISQDNPDMEAISDILGVPVSTLRYWQRKDSWVDKRKAAYSIVFEKSFNTAIEEINARRRQALENIDIAIEQAVEGLQDEELEFRDKKQAADVLRDYTRLIKDLYDSEEPKILLTEIGQVILEEVTDESEKQRIGARLLEIEKSWRQ